MRFALLPLAMLATDVKAGAWPRGEGASFVSSEHTATIDRNNLSAAAIAIQGLDIAGYTTLYAERGLSPTLTFGLDFGIGNELDAWTGLLFLRRSFTTDGPNVWAIEIAAGPRGLAGDEVEGVLRPSLQWGRGLDWGWLSVESYVEFRTDSAGEGYKLDATLGWRRNENESWIAQIQTADYPGLDPNVRFAPSYVRRLREGVSVELGLVADLVGQEDVGLTLGTWLDF